MTNTRDSASPIDAVDEELIDTLIAISVVAKRLAAKLRQSTENQREKMSPHPMRWKVPTVMSFVPT